MDVLDSVPRIPKNLSIMYRRDYQGSVLYIYNFFLYYYFIVLIFRQDGCTVL